LVAEPASPAPRGRDPQGNEIAYRAGRRFVHQLEPVALPALPVDAALPRRGVCLLVGGAGGLGAAFARHLAERYGARLVLTGRRPADARIEGLLAELRELGGEGVYAPVDAADGDAMADLVARTTERWGRIDAVLHSALVLEDAPLATMTEGAFRRA